LKSLYITGLALHAIAGGDEGLLDFWSCTNNTSASPRSASLIASPVPLATTRTSMPLRWVNSGSSYSYRPESWVEVVERRR